MKKVISVLFLALILVSSCKKEALQVPPSACISYPDNQTVNQGETITLINCSQNAIDYEWEIVQTGQNGSTLTSSAIAGNQWLLSNAPISAAINQSYNVVTSGWYGVKVTNSNGCSAKSDSMFIQLTGINDIEITSVVNVYPNPVMDKLNLELNSSIGALNGWTYSLMDATGRLVQFNHIQSFMGVVDFSALASGIYYLNITDSEHRATYKIAKQD